MFNEDGCIMSLLNDTKDIHKHCQINKEKTITNSFSLKYDKFHFLNLKTSDKFNFLHVIYEK